MKKLGYCISLDLRLGEETVHKTRFGKAESFNFSRRYQTLHPLRVRGLLFIDIASLKDALPASRIITHRYTNNRFKKE